MNHNEGRATPASWCATKPQPQTRLRHQGEEDGVYPPPQPLNLEEGGGGGRGSPLSRRPSPPPTMYTSELLCEKRLCK